MTVTSGMLGDWGGSSGGLVKLTVFRQESYFRCKVLGCLHSLVEHSSAEQKQENEVDKKRDDTCLPVRKFGNQIVYFDRFGGGIIHGRLPDF